MAEQIKLPPPTSKGTMSLEEAISKRRSVRRFDTQPLSLAQLSQILWSAQGLTSKDRRRAVPSAGATYPLELFVVIGEETVENLKAGIYRYEVSGHSLVLHSEGDVRGQLAEAALGQEFIAYCPADIIVCAIFSRTGRSYGRRGDRYVHMEAGHVGQNISLQAITLGLATVMVGAFEDARVKTVLQLDEQIEPLYIIPAGKPT